MPFDNETELELLDLRTSKLDGGTMRLYEAALPAGFQSVPGGILIAEIVLPVPAFNAATYNSAGNFFVATLRGTWGDTAANSGGTFGCFTVTNLNGVIKQRGPCGVAAGAVAGQLIVSAATVAQGAPVSVIQYTIEHDPLP